MNEISTPAAGSTERASSVYGPVRSWRFGRSLGIDPIVEISTCSFNCIYCQLGNIQRITSDRRVYVPTQQVAEDLRKVDWAGVDVVTISGSGEPTLAANLAEIIRAIRDAEADSGNARPIHILSNATLFYLPEVRASVAEANLISCKLDAPNDEILERINRPAAGHSVSRIVEGIVALRGEFRGKLTLQIMLMPGTVKQLDDWVPLIRQIGPDELQLNTPRRPYPLSWYRESRGDHDSTWHGEKRQLKVITKEEARAAECRLAELTGIKILSVYGEG